MQSAVPKGLHKRHQAELAQSFPAMQTKLCLATSRLRKQPCAAGHAGTCHIRQQQEPTNTPERFASTSQKAGGSAWGLIQIMRQVVKPKPVGSGVDSPFQKIASLSNALL